MKIRVYYEDTDVAGVVYYANYFKFIERARSEIFFANSLSPISNNSHFVVKNIYADFLRSAKFGDELEIKTEVVLVKSVSIELRQEIYRADKKLFVAIVKLVHLLNDRPAKIPDNIVSLFIK